MNTSQFYSFFCNFQNLTKPVSNYKVQDSLNYYVDKNLRHGILGQYLYRVTRHPMLNLLQVGILIQHFPHLNYPRTSIATFCQTGIRICALGPSNIFKHYISLLKYPLNESQTAFAL